MPSRGAALAVVALLLLAGCVASPDGTSWTTTTTASPTTAGQRVVDYGNLSQEPREMFLEAIEEGTATRDASSVIGSWPPEIDYVRYEGTTYDLSWSRGVRAEYRLDSVESVNDSVIGPEDETIAYSTLSDRGRRFFDMAIDGPGSSSVASDRFPGAFFEHDYVEFRGRYYRLGVSVADVPEWRLSVEETTIDGTESPG